MTGPGGGPRRGTVAGEGVVLVMVFLSGFAGLVYEVLWMRQAGLLLGSTARAAAITLAAFFAGLAAGSWFWGRRADRARNPLRGYALLEAGVAATALAYLALAGLFYAAYPGIYRSVGDGTPLLIVTCLVSLALVFPPAFCMGGSLPMVIRQTMRGTSPFGRTAARLYAANTLGAALGSSCAAFLLVGHLGYRTTYLLAVAISAAVAVAAWRLSRGAAAATEDAAHDRTRRTIDEVIDHGDPLVLTVCFLSGFSLLALEVLWTRLLAQVHSNSVYAFASVLTVVLTCLALGAWISSRLARRNRPPLPTLGALVTVAGIALALGPWLFVRTTGGLRPLSSMAPWTIYVLQLFYVGFAGIGIVVLALGTVFPFLMKMEERADGPGRALGRLLATNTLGAILGSLLCAFVLLPVLGAWRTMQLITAGYLATGLLVGGGDGQGRGIAARRTIAAIGLLLIFTLLDPTRLPTSGADPDRPPATVLETWEGTDCTVTVIEDITGTRAIRMNSGYVLGSTAAYADQVNQATVPLAIYPRTRSIFFLGLGTGITAGAALDPRFERIERIVACELVGEVVEAARTYMPPELTGGVFTDPRATIVIDDGRHRLRVVDETYDMINADLFLPSRRGAGSLYSLEHYLAAKRRLTPDGVFVQWLPLYQLTDREFGIIARTMLEAFEQVTLWRNNFTPGREIVALIGQDHARPIPAATVSSREVMLRTVRGIRWYELPPDLTLPIDQRTVTSLYCGDLTAARELFEDYPVSTDDRPLVEYLAPRTFRENAESPIIWFVGPKIAEMIDRLLERCPPDQDPMLRKRSAANRRLPYAGAAFHRARICEILGDDRGCERAWNAFVKAWRRAAE